MQAFEGVVIAKRNRSLNSSFIVRKISTVKAWSAPSSWYSPIIAGIEVKRRGDAASRQVLPAPAQQQVDPHQEIA